jgi:hypothetical protein
MHAGPVSTDAHRRRLGGAFALAALLLAAHAPAVAQRGALTVPRNLGQMSERAADIIRGTVVSARVEKHPALANLDTVVVTIRVRETVKGGARGNFTFRQYIWDIRDRWDAAGYRKGQDLLLVLNPPTRYGLTSPVGIEQGRFRIRPDGKGGLLALNGTGNAQLFDGVAAAAAGKGVALTQQQAALIAQHRGGPVELGELMAMFRSLTRAD